MKKTFKILAIVVFALLVFIAVVASFINLKGISSYETADFEYEHTSDSLALERGEKLASMLCAGCHMNPETGKLTGTHMLDAPKEFGEIHSPNITNDATHGIGAWTDSELVYLLRTGIKKDGRYAPPYMAKLPKMADEDINAIIAFLRSDHPLVAADPTPSIPTKPSFLTKMLTQTTFKPFEMPSEPIAMPDTNDMVALGEYLAVNLDCFSCHSADFKTNDFLEPAKSAGYFGGGNKTLNKKGELILTSNLTPHSTGIGEWTEEQFVRAVKLGKIDGEPDLRYPMNRYMALTDKEAKAIFSYLQTIPPIENKVERLMNANQG
jgi:mono/diheme cytochrome c family protein